MTTAERHIIALLSKLSPLAQAQLVDFAEFLLHKHGAVDSAVSAADILAEPLTETGFRTAEEVRRYLDEERDSWER